MASSDIFKTRAVVVRKTRYRESDLIVTLITESSGKIDVTARGGRKSQRRFEGGFSPYIIYSATINRSKKTGYFQVSELQAVEYNNLILRDPVRLGLSALATEIIREFTPWENNEGSSFHILRNFFREISSRDDTASCMIRLIFEILLKEGYSPVMDRCTRCNVELPDGSSNFSISAGGITCDRCSSQNEMNSWNFELWRKIMRNEIIDNDTRLSSGMLRNMVSLAASHAGKQFKAMRYVSATFF
ncbi:MAG: DNA repair protein RecO [Deltaproteobacteria bacterium]|nr:DNA repair protein RecO [Deltaproteobacteria bacterium]